MDLLQLRFFCTVAENLNISKAAKLHHVSQSTMSRSMSNLERELGVPLFARVANQISLTDQGAIFLEGAKNSLLYLDSAISTLQSPDLAASGTIRLYVKHLKLTLIDAIIYFKRSFPNVKFQIFDDLESCGGSYDLAISSTPGSSLDTVSKHLIREPYMLIVWKGHPLAGREAVDISDLEHEELVFSNEKANVLPFLRPLCAQHGFSLNVTVYDNDLYSLRKMVTNRLCITVGTRLSWSNLNNDEVRMIPFREDTLYRDTFVYTDKHRLTSPIVKRFYRFLSEYYKKLGQSDAPDANA